MNSSVVVEIALPANIRREADWWIANCPALDVCSQGPSRDEALVNLEDAVVFFIESCLERGTLFEGAGLSGPDTSKV
jgi:predicted RNase H-like HicB family nuclease